MLGSSLGQSSGETVPLCGRGRHGSGRWSCRGGAGVSVSGSPATDLAGAVISNPPRMLEGLHQSLSPAPPLPFISRVAGGSATQGHTVGGWVWQEHTLLWSVPLFPQAMCSTLGWTLLPSALSSVRGPAQRAQHQVPPRSKAGKWVGRGLLPEFPRTQASTQGRSGRPGGTLPPRLPFTSPTEVSSKPPPPHSRGRKSPGVTEAQG